MNGAEGSSRRRFLGILSRLAMLAGLVGGYGAFGAVLGRFLYPGGDGRVWRFVTPLDRLAVGDSLTWTTPAGAEVHVTRRSDTGGSEDVTALSSVCPHLGCRVHWQPRHGRYFCPCHNGVFDAEGRGIAGPPAGSALSGYPVDVRNGLLFVQVTPKPLVVPGRRS